ncbi:MAG: mitotic spindle organizing protein 1 [Amphiamblys sp. WSBS2006]|nr:MAG: mitotic spindle organizing protein 1 [Amphiamblys sp. WSBS2006]
MEVDTDTNTLDLVFELSNTLGACLEKEQLKHCVDIIEAGANPETLAVLIKELQMGSC